MLEHAAIIALLVLAIWYTYQEGEIFGFVQRWESSLDGLIPLFPPLFGCNVCMTPWYGSGLYWLIPWERMKLPQADVWQWPVVVIAAMGINAVINKLQPKDEIDVNNHY